MMKNLVGSYVEKFKHAKQARRRVVSVMVALALVVSCGVYWEMREDGMAMANETFCGMEEHLHGDECYEEVLVCGQEEGEDHTHDASCYESVLTCEMPEHTHTVACLIDETANVEAAADWEDTLPEEVSGIWADDVVAVAESQLGYTESEANFQLDEDGETRQGYTRYGEWYGNPYGDWDAMFASFCLYYAGVPEDEFPEASGVYAWTTELNEMEEADETGETVLLVDADGYIPDPGDLVFFDMDEEDNIVYEDGTVDIVPDHVGIVEAVQVKTVESEEDYEGGDEVALEKIWVIEGGRENEVQRVVYDFTSEEPEDIEAVSTIAAYGILPENPETSVEVEEEESVEAEGEEAVEAYESVKSVTYTAEDGGVMVEVSVPEGALPEDAELVMTLIDEDSEEYSEAASLIEEAEATEEMVGTYDSENDNSFTITIGSSDEIDEREDGMAVLDISFMVDDEEVEPTEPADVVIDASALMDEYIDGIESIGVWHLEETEDGADPVMVYARSCSEGAQTGVVEFTVDSFSQFTVNWFPRSSDTGHFGQIYVNLYNAENGEDISSSLENLDYYLDGSGDIVLSEGSAFLEAVGGYLTEYSFSYATVTAREANNANTYGDKADPVAKVTLGYDDSESTYVWTYTFYDADGATLYSYTETGRNGNTEPCLNLYFAYEPYVITWNEGTNRSYVSYETRDEETGELLGGSASWTKTGAGTAISMTSDGLLSHVSLNGYNYSYATVSVPNGKTYGKEEEPVTAIWATVAPDSSGGSTWTYSIRSGNNELDTVTVEYGPANENAFDASRDLLITLYYVTESSSGCWVALDSTSGNANYGGRDYIKGLEEYMDDNGNITITLPDDKSLGSDYVVYKDESTGEKVTVNASEVEKNDFDWKVVGWFNIATGDYVDVSEGPAETTINLKNDLNVFYADLEAADYDVGYAEDDVIESDMTGDFVTVKLFDYNELFNLYSSELTQESIERESWDAGKTAFAKGGSRLYPDPVLDNNVVEWYSSGKDITKSFLFTDTGFGAGNLACPSNLNAWNEWTGNKEGVAEINNNGEETGRTIQYQLTSASFNWNVETKDSELLRMLFDESGNTLGVHYVGKAEGLFQFGGEDDELEIIDEENPLNNQYYDFNGYYYYSASINGATYNQSEERFYLHEEPEERGNYKMFLPFNSYKQSLANSEIDYWFGMEMQVDFYLPGATGEKNTNDGTYVNMVEDKDMQFFFTGDDDIMVFVDDTLVLDMAGIHDEAVGWINFATGEYYYHCLDQVGGTSGGRYEGYFTPFFDNNGNWISPYKISEDETADDATKAAIGEAQPLQLDAGTHTLTVYYLERGAGASNLTVSFNIMPSWRYYSDETTTVTAEKEWADGNENHETDVVAVGLFREVLENECASEPNDGESVTYTVTDAETGTKETYTFINGSDYAYDNNGNVVAMLDYKTEDELERQGVSGGQTEGEDKTLYVLVDKTLLGDSGTQGLSNSNDWTFAWEMLDNDRTYRVLELEVPDGYTMESSSSTFDTWKYWSIIGENELEAMYEDDENEHWIILTDAAASWDTNEDGYPVKGNVVRNNISTGTAEVVFTEEPRWDYSNDGYVWAEFGEIPDSQISGKDLRWQIEFTGDTSHDEDYGKEDHTFYLKSESDLGQYIYVSTVNGVETLRKGNLNNIIPTAFYVDDLGELRVDGEDKRVVYVEDADTGFELQVVGSNNAVESEEDNHNIRLYTLSDVETYGTAFTITNIPAYELPSTGGPGKTPYAAAGFALIGCAAGGLLYRNRKKGVRQ